MALATVTPHSAWKLRNILIGLISIWALGWIAFFLVENADHALGLDSIGILAAVILIPSAGVCVLTIGACFLHSRGWLLRSALLVAGIAIAYATLSSFRYDYVRSSNQRGYVQVDTWLSRQRSCHMSNTNVYCFDWQ